MKFIRFEMAGKAEIGILNKEETGILPLSRIYPGFGVTIMQQVIEGAGENESSFGMRITERRIVPRSLWRR